MITPEGCAAILWKTAQQAAHAAKSLKLTAKDLKKLNLVDDILPEPMGGGHRNPSAMLESFDRYMTETLRDLKRVRLETLLKHRYERLRSLGSFFEHASEKKAIAKIKPKEPALAPPIRLADVRAGVRRVNGISISAK